MDLAQKFRGLTESFSQTPLTRISRSGMPDGFLFRNLLWYGDAGTPRTAVSRGIVVEPDELPSLDDSDMESIVERLRRLIATMGNEYTLQVKLSVGGDYSDVLDRYASDTTAINDRQRFRWSIWNRTERHARYTKAMHEGKLRREVLVLFFSRVVDTRMGGATPSNVLAQHFDALARRESEEFEKVHLVNVRSLFPECRVHLMDDREHFFYCYRFFNPNVGAVVPPDTLQAFDPSASIVENCLFGDLVQPQLPGVSFQLDGMNHAVLVMRELPTQSGPGLIARLLYLGFSDFEITLNLYPQDIRKVIDAMGKAAKGISGEIHTNAKQVQSNTTQHRMANQRIDALEEGSLNPMNLFLALRLWHPDAHVLSSRSKNVKNAFIGMHGASCYLATNPETARNLFYQTFPGWTYGDYRGYDLLADDATAAELMPWSVTFTGRLDGAEALYESPGGGLVGVSSRVGKTGQHMLILGATGAGKSILLTDWFAQVAPRFGYLLIVEEGLSHGTTAQALGAQPIVLSPNSSVVINYLDPNGTPLSPEHFAGCVGLGVQMLGESESNPSRVSEIQGVLSAHLERLYDGVWKEWALKHSSESHRIARRACALLRYLNERMRPKDGDTFLDAWAEVRDREAEGDPDVAQFLASIEPGEVARFMTDKATRHLVRNVGFASLSPEEMPTHSQLVDLLTYAPIDGPDANPKAVEYGKRLAAWKRNGPHGQLFDGITTHRMDAPVTLFELGRIEESMEALRAAAHYLILNVSYQQIIKRPRAMRKFVLFEEAARIIRSRRGGDVLSKFFTQLRKYGAVAVLVLQQIDVLKHADPSVRASVLDNIKLFLVSAQPSTRAAEAIGEALELPASAVRAIKEYPSAEHQTGEEKFSSFLMVAPHPTRRIIGTLRNVATPEVVYCGASDNEIFDSRNKALQAYPDVVTGIITEARKAL